MKRAAFLCAILCCFLFGVKASASIILEYDGGVHNYTGAVYSLAVNGNELTSLPLEPIIFNDRALVPVREVFEALGATVLYEPDTKKVTVIYKGKTGVIQIDSAMAEIDGKPVEIPDGVTPKLIAKWGESAKTMVPVRFVSDSVGLWVDFDAEWGRISVSEPTLRSTITGIYAQESYGAVIITAEVSGSISQLSAPVCTENGVLYVDASNMAYAVPNTKEINIGAVTTVRLGTHGSMTRIAVDTDNPSWYTVNTSGNSILITVGPPKGENSENAGEVQTDSSLCVVLDAGHGGSDPGAIGHMMTEEELWIYHSAANSGEGVDMLSAGTGNAVNEKDVALSVVQKVKARLEERGVNVVLTRAYDVYPTLDERPELANSIGAAMFLSIHLNSTASQVTTAHGMEIYYSEMNNGDDYGITSKEMASIILRNAVGSVNARSRGVKSGNLVVVRKSVMPANLIELGFMNNPDELTLLISEDYQNKIADGIAKGIVEVLGKIKKP